MEYVAFQPRLTGFDGIQTVGGFRTVGESFDFDPSLPSSAVQGEGGGNIYGSVRDFPGFPSTIPLAAMIMMMSTLKKEAIGLVADCFSPSTLVSFGHIW